MRLEKNGGAPGERVEQGLYTPAVIVVYQLTPIGKAVLDLELVLDASLPEELEMRLIRLPAELTCGSASATAYSHALHQQV